MFKRFLKDSLVYGVAGFLSRGISIILVPLYTRLLRPAEYGMVDILNVFGTVVGLTVALEIAQGIARYYPGTKDPDTRLAYSSSALWFAVGAYSLFFLACVIGARELSRALLDSANHRDIIFVAALSISAGGIFRFALEMLRWDLRPSLYSAVSVANAGVIVLAVVLFVLVLRMGVLGVFCAMLAGGTVGAGLSLYLGRGMYELRFDWNRCRELLRFSLPLVPSSVGVFVALYIDRIAIKELMSLADLGVFGVGYRVASAVGFVMVGCQTALVPLIFTYFERPETRAELARIFRYFVAAALLMCLALSIFAQDILALFTTRAYYGAVEVIPILAPAVLLSSMSIFAPGLSIEKRTTTIAIISLSVAALNTILNFTLVPVLGIRGAALSTLVSASLGFLTYMVLSQRFYHVPHRWKSLAFATIATIIAGILGSLFAFGVLWNTLLRLIEMIAITLLFIRLGLISRSDIVRGWQRLRVLVSYKPESRIA